MSTLPELVPHQETLRSGARQGLKYKALATLLKREHGVEVETVELLRRWLKEEASETLGEGVAGNAVASTGSGAGGIEMYLCFLV